MKWAERGNLKDYFSRKIMQKEKFENWRNYLFIEYMERIIFSKNFKWIANL